MIKSLRLLRESQIAEHYKSRIISLMGNLTTAVKILDHGQHYCFWQNSLILLHAVIYLHIIASPQGFYRPNNTIFVKNCTPDLKIEFLSCSLDL